jgi:hypothetical protein
VILPEKMYFGVRLPALGSHLVVGNSRIHAVAQFASIGV